MRAANKMQRTMRVERKLLGKSLPGKPEIVVVDEGITWTWMTTRVRMTDTMDQRSY